MALMNSYLASVEPIIKSITEFEKGDSLEEIVIKKFIPFYGLDYNAIVEHLNIFSTPTDRNRFYLMAKSILGVKNQRIEEFEKADVKILTVHLEQNGKVKRSMPFHQIDFKEIKQEGWYDSTFRDKLESKFLFIFFQVEKEGLILKKVRFWNMPYKDIEAARKVWSQTKKIIKIGKLVKEQKGKRAITFFPDKKSNPIAYVRPYAQNSNDTLPLPFQDKLTKLTTYTKHSFWLNNTYIRNEIYLR
jgi:DNA mismatch repair protein MutH